MSTCHILRDMPAPSVQIGISDMVTDHEVFMSFPLILSIHISLASDFSRKRT